MTKTVYVAKIPDLEPSTLRSYSRLFQEQLKNRGVIVFNNFLEGHSDKSIIDALPAEDERDLTLSVEENSIIFYGWNLEKCWKQFMPDFVYIDLFNTDVLIGYL